MTNPTPFFALLLATAATVVCPGNTIAQKASPVELSGLLAKIPIPANSSACYAAATKTDASNGMVSIKDNGSDFTTLHATLIQIVTSNGSVSAATARAYAPSAAEVAQMKQQGAAMKNMTPDQAAQAAQAMQKQYAASVGATPGPVDPQLTKLIGDAQKAAGQMSALIQELSAKLAKLDRSPIDAVKQGPKCPDVQQGEASKPACDCLKSRATDYATRRVTAEDVYLQQAAALFRDCIGQLRTQAAVVDNMEQKAKYGDAFSSTAIRQVVVSIQENALGSVTAAEGLSNNLWGDAANMYANQVNAASGASSNCAAHK